MIKKNTNKKFEDKGTNRIKSEKVSLSITDECKPILIMQKNLDLAFKHHKAGNLSTAEGIYQQILQTDPNQPIALHMMGLIARKLGNNNLALGLISKTLAINPDNAEAYSDLGNALQALGKLNEAIESYKKALTIKPNLVEAHYNLGTAHQALNNLDEAITSYGEALNIRPDLVEAHYNLGNAHRDLGKFEEAVESYSCVLKTNPENAKASIALSYLLYKFSTKNSDKAQELALKFVKAFPNNKILMRGVSGITKTVNYSTKIEKLYTTCVFDNFAKTFDKTLEKLNYDLPQQLARAAGVDDGEPSLDILDAGCGTGLCGIHLRARARHLVGVDLSVNMLTVAREKRLYDDLVEADLVSFMEDKPASFDLVISADVLVYIGEITPLAQAVYLTLRPGGVCVVSVESLDEDVESPFLLAPSGRYQHSAGYIRETFTSVGFIVNPLQKTSARLESGNPVPTWIVTAYK